MQLKLKKMQQDKIVPLHLAVQSGKIDIIKLLLEFHASPSIVNVIEFFNLFYFSNLF